MSQKTLAKNTICLYVVALLKLIAPLITLPYLTRVLSVETYGVVSFVKAYCTYVQLFVDFGFLFSATRDIVESMGDKDKISKIVGDTIVEKTILGIGALVVTIATVHIVPILHNHMLFTVAYVISCLSTILILDFLYRGIEKMEYVAIPFAASKLISIIFTFVLVRSDLDYMLLPVLDIAGNIVAAIVSIACLNKFRLCIQFSGFSKWFLDIKDSGVFFISNFATTFLGAFTTLVVGLCMSSEEVAYWSLCLMVVSAAKALYSPISNSLYPRMISTKNITLVHKAAALATMPLLIVCILVWVWGECLMVLVAGESYEPAGLILRFMIPVFVFSLYSMLYGWPALGSIGENRATTVSTLIAAFVQIAGIIALNSLDVLSLITLALWCGVSEAVLLAVRLVILYRHRNSFIHN